MLILAVVAGAATVFAHDPLEITTTARIDANALTLEITSARSTALALAAGGRESPTFDPAEFDRYRARLAAVAPTLFTVTVDGRPLAAQASEVSLSVEGDVDFRVTYPRLASGTLRLSATHLAGLGYGYGNIVTVAGFVAAEPKMLTAAEPTLEIVLPRRTGNSPAVRAPAGSSADNSSSAARAAGFRPWLLIVSLGVMFVLLVASWRRGAKAPTSRHD